MKTCLICNRTLKRLSRSHLATHNITGDEYNSRFGIDKRAEYRQSLSEKRASSLPEDDKIKCQVCGLYLKRITRTHLLTHGMTTAEYKAKFGDEIVSVRLAHRLGKASREMTDERKQQVSKTLMPYCKMPKSESHRKNLSIAKTGTSWGSHTEEHKKNVGPKIAAALAEKRAKGWVRRHNLSDGGREKLRQKMKAWNDAWRDAGYPKRNTNKGMKLTLTEKQREARSRRQIERLVRGEIAGKTGTAPEIKMMQFLTSANIDYVHQFALGTEKGSWAYDFYIPERNLLVETDGEYFHAKSKCVINRDKIKERVARERGFDFIRISDKDWRPELVFASTEEQVAHCEDLLGRRLKMITERPDVSNS